MPTPTPRTEKLDLRLTPAAKRTLQTAAVATRRSVSEFVLESALARAQETLADRQRFGLDAEQWAAFQAALDAPPRPVPRLARLLQEPSVLDGSDGD
ncbi:hypothetical protein CKO25_07670 [Thiocapsa imhoffii]|uniref:DUF1778 domain-containing protein n=1 Tax=Thiocapsa imhoffii TaxID=382777 RepID=A0A9X0WGZ5_9GAMM|nr:DUF1778 domain-containing protein [Thiocapsa imhoffii]MBK1644534.1 hypothetical protein [Thiocapsa imhoffii]